MTMDTHDPIQAIESIIDTVKHDTYLLTRDDIDSIEARLRNIQQHMQDIYSKRGKDKL